MDPRVLKLGISPCPNDTFVFHHMVHAAPRQYELLLDDVEALNGRAERGELDVVKISVAAFGRIRERYALLRAGGAAGFGVGPLVVALEPRDGSAHREKACSCGIGVKICFV